MFVKAIMEKEVVSVKPGDTLKDVALLFASKTINGAPVVDEEKRVIGIVSDYEYKKGASSGY